MKVYEKPEAEIIEFDDEIHTATVPDTSTGLGDIDDYE